MDRYIDCIDGFAPLQDSNATTLVPLSSESEGEDGTPLALTPTPMEEVRCLISRAPIDSFEIYHKQWRNIRANIWKGRELRVLTLLGIQLPVPTSSDKSSSSEVMVVSLIVNSDELSQTQAHSKEVSIKFLK